MKFLKDIFYRPAHLMCLVISSDMHFLFCGKSCSLQINHPYIVLPKTMDFFQYGGHLLLFKSLKVNSNKNKKGLNYINT